MINQIFILIFFFFSVESIASKQVMLTESFIKGLIENNPPSMQQIEVSFLQSKELKLIQEDALSFQLEGESQLYKSKERLLSNFDGGVVDTSSRYSLRIIKPTSYGITIIGTAFSNQITNTFISKATTTGLSFNLSMDLYQNLLGKKTKSSLQRSAYRVERAKYEKK